MAWTQGTLLMFMQAHKEVFGDEITHIKYADMDLVLKLFTCKLFSALDWTQLYYTPYVDVVYEGNGDIKSINVKSDFCLTGDQCVDIANFIAGKIKSPPLNSLYTFAILNYIQFDFDLYTDYIGWLKEIVYKKVCK